MYSVLGKNLKDFVSPDLKLYNRYCHTPSHPADFVHPSNTSVRLDLFTWNKQSCPVDYFIVSYRKLSVSVFLLKLNWLDRSEKLEGQKDFGFEWFGLMFRTFQNSSVAFWRKKLRVIALPVRKSTSGELTFCASFEKLVKWQQSFWLETEIALDFSFLRTENFGCPIYSCI